MTGYDINTWHGFFAFDLKMIISLLWRILQKFQLQREPISHDRFIWFYLNKEGKVNKRNKTPW